MSTLQVSHQDPQQPEPSIPTGGPLIIAVWYHSLSNTPMSQDDGMSFVRFLLKTLTTSDRSPSSHSCGKTTSSIGRPVFEMIMPSTLPCANFISIKLAICLPMLKVFSFTELWIFRRLYLSSSTLSPNPCWPRRSPIFTTLFRSPVNLVPVNDVCTDGVSTFETALWKTWANPLFKSAG